MNNLKLKYNSLLQRSIDILKELDKPAKTKMGQARKKYNQAVYDELTHEMNEIIGQLETKGHSITMDEVMNGFYVK